MMTRVGRRREEQVAELCVTAGFLAKASTIAAKRFSVSLGCSTQGSRLLGSSALKVHDKIFAMVSSSGEFVVKLPKARVDALVASGERFDANRGRPMKEWLEVRSESVEEWLELAREALEFVGT